MSASQRFEAMNANESSGVGVVDHQAGTWAIPPVYDWHIAMIMASCLNEDPAMGPDKLMKFCRAKE